MALRARIARVMGAEADPPVDWVALEARYAGRPAAIARLIPIAIDMHRGIPATLCRLADEGDLEGIRLAAHGLAGGAHAILARPVGALSSRVEAACRERSPNAVELARELAAAVEILLVDLLRREAEAQD
jgi:HPt (histidine-containing phosphotransfer) domain-containing protein